jgi:hypothetical protein
MFNLRFKPTSVTHSVREPSRCRSGCMLRRSRFWRRRMGLRSAGVVIAVGALLARDLAKVLPYSL